MGCDIHLHIEIKIENEWHHYGCPRVPRHYKLFAKMAGVRNENFKIDPISSPKGLPDNITFLTAIDHSRENTHDESWFDIDEIKLLEEWFNEQAKEKPYNERCYHFLEDMTGYLFGNRFHKQNVKGTRIQDIRFVFWFDN